jgi:hypothetical protein
MNTAVKTVSKGNIVLSTGENRTQQFNGVQILEGLKWNYPVAKAPVGGYENF